MKHYRIYTVILLSVQCFASISFADLDCTQYDNSCSNTSYRTCTCTQNDDGTITVSNIENRVLQGYTGYKNTKVYNEEKNLLRHENGYYYGGDTNPATLTLTEYTYDPKGRKAEVTSMSYSYSYGKTDDLDGYGKAVYHYDSDDATNYSSSDSISVSQDGVNIVYNGKNLQLSNSIELTNQNIDHIKALVNSGDYEKVLAFTGGDLSKYRPEGGGMVSQYVRTNEEGILYNYIDDWRTDVTKVTEMYVQNEDGSVDVYDVSGLFEGDYSEIKNMVKNADPRTLSGATLIGKYGSVVQYYLRGVMGYSFSGAKGQEARQKKRIYTVSEAVDATKDGKMFNFIITYR